MANENVEKRAAKHFQKVLNDMEWLLNKSVWVCYKNESDIVNPDNGEPSYSDNPYTWGSFTAACDFIDNHEGYTLGLQLGRSSRITAVHISNCINSDGDVTNDQRVNELLLYCNSYGEYDVSGKGLTFLLLGNDILPYEDYIKKRGNIEISLYDYYQCIPLTGKPCEYNKNIAEEAKLGRDLYYKDGGPKFINAIYKWFKGEFSGVEKPTLGNGYSQPDIIDFKEVGGYANHQLNRLIRNNPYFQYLWYNNIPTDKGERHHDIGLVARIYSVVSYDERRITDIFKASPSFKAKSKEAQFKYEDEIRMGSSPLLALAGNSTGAYKDISTAMRSLINAAKKLNQDKDFMKYDNDIEMMRDEIYGDIIDLSNDKACSDIFLAAYGDKIKYCFEDKMWYVYDGSHWLGESNNALPHIRAYGEQLFERLNAVLNWYSMDNKEKKKLKSNINKFANVMPFKRTLESSRAKSLISSGSFNLDIHKLSVGNGVVDLKTGKLEKHDPSYYFSLHTDVNYYPSYCRPRMFIKFLNEIFKGDKELIAYFQRAMGYCITGDTAAQVFFVFHGNGANGKSTLINILNGVLNDYAGQFDSFVLARKNDGLNNPNPLLIDNQSKRYVVVSEKNEGTELDVALIKVISGGDNISARRLFENNLKPFKPTYKLILVTNFLPNINWNDDAIKRRYRIIPFTAKFKDEDADPKLAEKILANEKEMILKWLVDGARDYYKHERSLGELPNVMKEAVIKARNESKNVRDTLYAYKQDRLEITPDDESNIIQARALYCDYEQWCDETGHNKMTETAFGNKMPQILEVKKEKKRYVEYIGVKFKDLDSNLKNEYKRIEGERVFDRTKKNVSEIIKNLVK